MKPSIVRRMPCVRSYSAAIAALLILAACAPSRTAPPSGLPPREPLLAVGLHVDTTRIELGATTDFEIVEPAGTVLRHLRAAERVTVHAEPGGELRLEIGGQASPAGSMIVARPEPGGFILIGGTPYRGTALVKAALPAGLTVINEVGLEEYLLGVVPFELGSVGPELLEAAKAQAVAARTYAVRYLGRRAALGFDVFATVEDQVYGGARGEAETVSRAVRETKGEILTYRGEPIEAFYHSTCAGRTAAIEEVWPGERPRPYLVSVIDVNPVSGEAFDITSSRFRWTQRWSAEQLQTILEATLADSLPPGSPGLGEVTNLEVLRRTLSGRIAQLRITTRNHTFDLGGDRIRWILRTPAGPILNSSLFDVHLERDAQGRIREIVAEGMGWGHGIGMCQVGAMGRARAGQDYRTILHTYYTGAEIVKLY